MVFGINKILYPGYGGREDIRLSMQDYFEFVGALKQENFDNKYLMKFKNLYMINGFSCLALLVGATIPSYIGTRLVAGPVWRGHPNYKLYLPIFVTIYSIIFYAGSYKEIPRRLYTEIFSENSPQATYLRRTLRETKPNLWKHISAQLTNLGYTHSEQNEINNSQFPTALIN